MDRMGFFRMGLVALVLGMLLVGCAGSRPGVRTIYHDDENVVRLVPDPAVNVADPSTHHGHPLQLSADAVAALLRGIQVQERRGIIKSTLVGKTPRHNVFSDDQVAFLAPQLQDALAKALPTEQIVFFLSRIVIQTTAPTSVEVETIHDLGSADPAPVQEITSGSLAVQDRYLHLILANYRYAFELRYGKSRYDATWPELPIAPQEYDLQFERDEMAVRPTRGAFTRWFRSERPEILIDYARFLRAEDIRKTANAGQAGTRPPAARPADAPAAAPPEAGATPALSAETPAQQTQVLNDQLRLMQQLLKEKLRDIETLKAQLAEAQRKLAAKDAELKQLKAKRNPGVTPKK